MSAATKTVMALALVLAGCGTGEQASPKLFDESREFPQGIDHVWEFKRLERVSFVRSSSDHYGGALGGGFFGLECFGKLCAERGYPYYVMLDDYLVRNAPASAKGPNVEHIIGFVQTDEPDIRVEFPEYFQENKVYLVLPADFEANYEETMERLGEYVEHVKPVFDEARPSLVGEEQR